MSISTALKSNIDSQTILQRILDANPEEVIVATSDSTVLAVNSAAQRSFGRNGSLVGQLLRDVVASSEVLASFRNASTVGRTADLQLNYLARSTRKYDVHVAPLELEGEQMAIGFFYDITQVDRLETIRQEFLSNISHELRTPLTSILAFVETLEDGGLEDDEKNRHFLSVIRRNGERMRNLIADILELSQIESGNVSLKRTNVQLSNVVGDIFTNLSSMAATREISLRNEVAPVFIVRADQKRLEQMLTNLIDNAIRFNRRGGSVTVVASETAAKSDICVSDTGEGIVPDQAHRIFERFYRVDRARSRDIGGTGLGLAIVKHLARLHGGEVSVRSELSVGTTFKIELPVP